MYRLADINFPDKEYLKGLIRHQEEKMAASRDDGDWILALTGISLNWVGDYLSDTNVAWSYEELTIDRLWLTGTQPEWNRVVIDQCERSAVKLCELMLTDDSIKDLFSTAEYIDLPILVRYEDDKYKVLDGMHRTIAAIRDGHRVMRAYVARLTTEPHPYCEAHVVYDLLRAYMRGMNRDREGLVQALLFLKRSFGNVESLLRERFNSSWVMDTEIQEIIAEVLSR